MAITSILFKTGNKVIVGAKKRTGWNLFANKYTLQEGGFEIDATINEVHEFSATVTQSQIEDGSTISDHIIINPIRLNLEGVITETPISFITSALTAGASALSSNIPSKFGAAAATLGGASLSGLLTSSRSPDDVYKVLKELFEKREPFTVVTGLTVYDNMVFTSLSIPRSAQYGRAIKFSATLEQLKIVQTKLVPVPEFKVMSGIGSTVSSTQDLGDQASSAASEAASSKGSSILKNLVNFFKG